MTNLAAGGQAAQTDFRVLIVDDDPDMTAMLVRHLEREDVAVVAAIGGQAALNALASQEFDVVVTDLVMDRVGGLEVLAAAGRCRPTPRVILMTAFGTLETAIEAMRQGAYDYLTKPFKLAEVTVAVRRAFDDHRLRRENEQLRAGRGARRQDRGREDPRCLGAHTSAPI